MGTKEERRVDLASAGHQAARQGEKGGWGGKQEAPIKGEGAFKEGSRPLESSLLSREEAIRQLYTLAASPALPPINTAVQLTPRDKKSRWGER